VILSLGLQWTLVALAAAALGLILYVIPSLLRPILENLERLSLNSAAGELRKGPPNGDRKSEGQSEIARLLSEHAEILTRLLAQMEQQQQAFDSARSSWERSKSGNTEPIAEDRGNVIGRFRYDGPIERLIQDDAGDFLIRGDGWLEPVSSRVANGTELGKYLHFFNVPTAVGGKVRVEKLARVVKQEDGSWKLRDKGLLLIE
jgi:HAMP domain-containing protein